MEHSFSYDTATIRHQFDYVCKRALKNGRIDYQRQKTRKRKHEILMSELPVNERKRLFLMDEYSVEHYKFQVLGYNIAVKDGLLAEALQSLSERKRNVVLLYYYMDMTDAEIARELKLVRSTVQEQRARSIELLRQKMRGNADEKK